MKCREITSKTNAKIKNLRKLSQKKYRRLNSEFIVENLITIYDALKSGYDIKDLFVTQEFINKNRKEFDYLIETSKLKEYYLIDEELNQGYSQLDTPSGITAVYDINASSLDMTKSIIYLDGINDPGNMGSILRTALAFDIPNIVLSKTCVDLYNSKVLNAAKDSIFKLNILENQDLQWFNKKSKDLPIYVSDAQSGVSLTEVKPENRFCLVLGSESHGVSEDIVKIADMTIRIEISKNIESLNVSAAAAILLHGLCN